MHRRELVLTLLLLALAASTPLAAKSSPLTLAELVEPSTVFRNEEGTVTLALHFFIEFETLEELFAYIDEQTGRWTFASPAEREAFATDLLRRGLESRVISMAWDWPREVLTTHTDGELAAAIHSLPTASDRLIYEGQHWRLDLPTYEEAFLRLQERWKTGLNCWSAAPSIPARVLSNWYIIEEGIELYGAMYDSTEHFWQAIKYHPEVGLKDLAELIDDLRAVDWAAWIDELGNDQPTYFEHGYSVEFLRHNLSPQKLEWFADEIARYAREYDAPVRRLKERDPSALRFTSFESKVLWGDLADVFHLLWFFGEWSDGRFATPELESVRETLTKHRFDAIYLPDYEPDRFSFVSPDFRRLMLEIWKVKYLEHKRFGEVIRSTGGLRLLHSLHDASSADIPVPEYVEYMEQIRKLAFQ